jgi:alpha-tubulin suppressor-like RCC1 family protein
VSAGLNHTIGIKTNGTLWAWGDNSYGQVGDGTTTNRITPVQIGSETNWLFVSAGNNLYNVAILTDGTLWAWGQIYPVSSTPKQIGTDRNWATVSASDSYAMGIRTDGTLWAWGSMWGVPPSGDRNAVEIIIQYGNTPVRVGTAVNWASVSVGTHAIATRTDGTIWAWGNNRYGQLGDGTTIDRLTPVQIRVP